MSGPGLWHVFGSLTAPDGTSGRVEYWGDPDTARLVFSVTVEGASDRGDGLRLSLLTSSGLVLRREAFEVGGGGARAATGVSVVSTTGGVL